MPARILIQGAAGSIEVAADVPEAPVATAVIAHPHPLYGGTMDNKVVTTIERAFRELGAATFRFNFRGVGKTAGTLKVVRYAQDHVRGVALWLAGFSFGGAVATRASLRVEFAKLVLVAPGFRRLTGEGLGTPIDPRDPQFGEPGRHTHENTVVVHGDLDETVPLSDSLAWAAAREVNVVVVAGGEHFFHRKLHLLRDAVARMARP